MLRLTLKNLAGMTPLRKLPMEVTSDEWICSDSIMYVCVTDELSKHTGHSFDVTPTTNRVAGSVQGAARWLQRTVP